MNQLVPFRSADASPALVAAAGDQARIRFLEFFTANIRNRNTRRAYAQAVAEFLAWCEHHRLSEKRRLARKRRRNGEPRLDAHHAALRSPARRSESRRGGADSF
jgi:hypothetical protein